MSLRCDLENDVKLGKETPKEKMERKEMEKFDETLNEFFIKLRERDNKYMTEKFENLGLNDWDISFGRKFVKITRGSSVYAFIDISNGDILKPASWRAPAKHARGNIFNDDPLVGTDIYGPRYIIR